MRNLQSYQAFHAYNNIAAALSEVQARLSTVPAHIAADGPVTLPLAQSRLSDIFSRLTTTQEAFSGSNITYSEDAAGLDALLDNMVEFAAAVDAAYTFSTGPGANIIPPGTSKQLGKLLDNLNKRHAILQATKSSINFDAPVLWTNPHAKGRKYRSVADFKGLYFKQANGAIGALAESLTVAAVND